MEKNKYWKYEFFDAFLDTVKDCNYVNLDSVDLLSIINGLTRRAIEAFSFPKVSLDYAYDAGLDDTGLPKGYYFIDDKVSYKEYNVIIAYMCAYWVSYQITYSKNFRNPYYDKSISGFSPAALLASMDKAYNTFMKIAKETMRNYERVTKDGTPLLGSFVYEWKR